MKVERLRYLGFRSLGFRVRSLAFRVQGLGFGVQVLGGFWGLGCLLCLGVQGLRFITFWKVKRVTREGAKNGQNSEWGKTGHLSEGGPKMAKILGGVKHGHLQKLPLSLLGGLFEMGRSKVGFGFSLP